MKKGQYKSTLFPQIVEALEALQDENIPLYVTTSKHEPVALQMCQDLGIAKYFKGIMDQFRSYPQSRCHSIRLVNQ